MARTQWLQRENRMLCFMGPVEYLEVLTVQQVSDTFRYLISAMAV